VYNSDLKTLEIVLPDFDEQNKIASFLSLLNERIQTQSKIIEGLKLQKEFIARKIFRQQNRFKNQAGNEFPKWEMKTLGKISKIAKSGGTPLSTRKNYYGGDIPFLSISDMTLQGKYLTYTANSITQLGLNNSSSWIVPINSIIYSMYASVGFVSINKIPLATSQAVLNLSLESNINIEFVYYYLIEFQKKVSKFVTTGTQGNLNAETVKRFEIPVPTLKEQDKIGFFLSSIDERIDTEEKILKNYENQKKYLLVNLFI